MLRSQTRVTNHPFFLLKKLETTAGMHKGLCQQQVKGRAASHSENLRNGCAPAGQPGTGDNLGQVTTWGRSSFPSFLRPLRSAAGLDPEPSECGLLPWVDCSAQQPGGRCDRS